MLIGEKEIEVNTNWIIRNESSVSSQANRVRNADGYELLGAGVNNTTISDRIQFQKCKILCHDTFISFRFRRGNSLSESGLQSSHVDTPTRYMVPFPEKCSFKPATTRHAFLTLCRLNNKISSVHPAGSLGLMHVALRIYQMSQRTRHLKFVLAFLQKYPPAASTSQSPL